MFSSRMSQPNVVRLDSAASAMTVLGANTSSGSVTHTISGTAVFANLNITFNGTSGTPTTSASIDGNDMTVLLKSRVGSNAPYYNWCLVFGLLNPPKGSKTISFSYTNTGSGGGVYACAASYHGVLSLGTTTSAGPTTSTSASVTSSSTPVGGMVYNAFFGNKWTGTAALSSYNQNQLLNAANNNNYQATLIGDARGAGSAIEFTATAPSSTAWTGFTVPLLNQ